MTLKKILSLLVAVTMLFSCIGITALAEETGVAKIGDTAYATFDEAITAANAMTGDVTVEIYGKTEYTDSTADLTGAYNVINFVGMTDDAEISITRDGSGGYISGSNQGNDCVVNYKDLILSKPTGAYANDAGFMNVYFTTYRVGEVNYTNCTFPDGACAQGCPVTYTNCDFANKTSGEYSLWVYANTTTTVTECTFTGVRGAKMYGEGAAKTGNLVMTNTTFTDSVTEKPAIVLTYGESVELEGNTYPAKGTFELDLGGAPNGTTVISDKPEEITCVNDNGDCGVLVNNTIYTTVADAAAVATAGSTVTLLHDSTETVELAEGVIFDANSFTAENVTVAAPATATIGSSQINMEDENEVFISAEISGLDKAPATQSVVIKTYSGETLVATTTLAKNEYFANATLSVKICLNGDSSSWDTVWEENMPRADYIPDKNVLYVDGVEVSEAAVRMISTSGEAAVNWADVPGVNPAPVIPAGALNKAYISASYINGVPAVFGEATGVVATESFVVKLYSGENLVGTAALVDNDKVLLNGKSKTITWHAALTDDGDEWWSTTWENGALNISAIPDKAALYVDGVKVSTCDVQLNLADFAKPVFAAVTDNSGNVQSFVAGSGYLNGTDENAPVYDETLKSAINTAEDGDTITLLRDIAITETVQVNFEGAITIDGNGHKITNNGATNAAVVLGSSGYNDTHKAAHKVTLKNVVFDGWTTEHVVRAQGVTAAIEGCEFINCDQTSGLGLLTLTFADATVTDCVFKGNKCIEVIDVNSWGDNSGASVTIKECTFENNTASGLYGLTGVIAAFYGEVSIENNEFVGNTAATNIVYTETNADVEGNYFAGNSLNSDDEKKAVIMAGPWHDGEYTVNINENAFTDEYKGAYVEQFENYPNAVTTYNLSSNYWNGGEPNYGITGEPTVELNDYYTVYSDGTLSGLTQAPVTGLSGTGTAEDPYLINNIDELKWFRDDVNSGNNYSGKYVKLASDINLVSVENWTPIGNSDNKFLGHFDGGNNKISNLKINNTSSYVGFFGYTSTGSLKNLTLENVDIDARLGVGALVGCPFTSDIENITLIGKVTIDAAFYVGSVAGRNAYGNLIGITVNVEEGSYVNANSIENGTSYRTYVGGVVGFLGEGSGLIKNVTSNIKVIGNVQDVGGIAGIAHYGNTFEDVTFSGSVEAPADAKEVGGIAGVWHNQAGKVVTFTNVVVSENATVMVGEENVTETNGLVGGAYNSEKETPDESGSLIVDGEEVWLKVAKIGDVKYASLTEAIENANAGDTITMIADATLAEKITLPAGITFNGNGFHIDGTVLADGDLKFEGYTKVSNFNAGYNTPTITIGEGACLELTGSDRMVIGHGATFNITGTITDAKTANTAELTPSLIMPGASFTGAGVNFNVTNAYIKTTASYCSSSKSASGTFNFDINNSVWEQFGKLAFEAQSTAATVNFNLKDSVLTTTSHLIFGVAAGEIVIDNSYVNKDAAQQLENRSNLTIKNGSVVYAKDATSSNAKKPGTLTVDNATYVGTGEFSGSDVGTGNLVLKNNANVTLGTISKTNVAVDGTSLLTATKIADVTTTTVSVDTTSMSVGESRKVVDLSSSESIESIVTVTGNADVTYGEDGDVTVTKSATPVFEIAGTNAKLGNSLAINFFVEEADLEGENYYAVIEHDDKENGIVTVEIPYSKWEARTMGTVNYRVIAYSGIAARQMADDLTITIYKNDKTAASVPYTESLSSYALKSLAWEATSESWKSAFVDMLNYGAAAQEYFDYNEEDLANKGAENYQSYASTEVNVESVLEFDEAGNGAGTSLTLKDRVLLNGFFKNVTEDMRAEISFTNHYGEEKLIQVSYNEFSKRDDTYHIITVDELVIADAAQPVTITVYDAEGNVHGWIKESVNGYLSRIMENEAYKNEKLFPALAKFAASACKTLSE